MTPVTQLAKRFKEVLLDGSWVVSTNYQAQLHDLTWEQATTRIGSLNTIADLVFHINYYIAGLVHALKSSKLEIRDKYSFDYTSVQSQKLWEKLVSDLLDNAEKLAQLLEQMPIEKLDETFIEEKYGDHKKNINALIEHSYYHLGQIVLLKKLVGQVK